MTPTDSEPNPAQPIPFTRSGLHADLRALGVRAGDTLMLHSSVRAVAGERGIMGGPDTILHAIFDALGPAGTLMMYVGWQDIPDYTLDLPPAARAVYRAEHPPFDPATARAVRENSILAEFLRTWPGARRSHNPECSMAAVGTRAVYLTEDHPLNYGYGAGSPLEKLVTLRGRVLLLGRLLDNITLLHYAENRAALRAKRRVHYECPILRAGRATWFEIDDFDTGEPHADYRFDQIAEAYRVGGGAVRQGLVGAAPAFLFDAPDLVGFAIRWLEERYG